MQALIPLEPLNSPFNVGYFEIKPHFYDHTNLNHDPIYASPLARMTGTCYHT
jgi:hypothetical protein